MASGLHSSVSVLLCYDLRLQSSSSGFHPPIIVLRFSYPFSLCLIIH